MEIRGIFDENSALAEKVSAEYSLPRGSLDGLLDNPGVEVVCIAGRTLESTPFTIAAMQHGKHVLVEKPAANSGKTMARLFRTAQRCSTCIRIGYTWDFLPFIPNVRELLASGLLGRITLGRIHMGYPVGGLLEDFFCWPQAPGGVFFEAGCDHLDLLLQLVGKPRSVSARIEKYDRGDHPYEDVAVAILEYDDFLISLDLCGWEANEWSVNHRFEFYGTKGTLFFGVKPPWYRLYLRDAAGQYPEGWSASEYEIFSQGFQMDLDALMRLIEANDIPSSRNSLLRGRDVIMILESAYTSASKGGRAVKI
jgi:predicted dehydrogenase